MRGNSVAVKGFLSAGMNRFMGDLRCFAADPADRAFDSVSVRQLYLLALAKSLTVQSMKRLSP